MRSITLNATSAGMTRLRTKGGASQESLYDLYNGYVNASKIPRQRPASVWKFAVPLQSQGLVYFKGVFYTFSAQPVTAIPGSTNIVLPNPVPGNINWLKAIHFAQPFMGYLYVVAEFLPYGTIPGGIYHFWLQNPPKRQQGGHAYKANDLVQPEAPNGYYYRCLPVESTAPAWTAGLQHKLGDYVQPTKYNGFKYRADKINGLSSAAPPVSSGAVEPIWPTKDRHTVVEGASGAINTDPASAPTPPAPIPPGMRDGPGDDSRYGNPGGSGTIPWARTPVRVR